MKSVTVGCFILIAACVAAGTTALAVEGVDGVLFHPERVDAHVKGCQVSKPGSYDIEAGSAIELSYAFPVVPQAMPKKVSYDVTGEAVNASDLGVRRMEHQHGTVGETRVMFYFRAMKRGESSVMLIIDGEKYDYAFKVNGPPRAEDVKPKKALMKYLVIGSEGPGFSTPKEAVRVLDGIILPSFDRLIKLEADGKIVAAGLPVGERKFVFIVEASSNDELDQLLRSLPMWGSLKWNVTALQNLESRATQERQILQQLKQALH